MTVIDFSVVSLPSLGNVLLFIASIFLLNLLWHLYDFRGMPPGPRFSCLPVAGNVLNIIRDDSTLQSLRGKYGELFSFKAGSWRVVRAATPESIKEVLINKSADFAGRPPFYSFLVETLGGKDIAFGNYGPAWKLHRKLFTICLRQYVSNISLLESRIAEHATKLLQHFKDQHEQPFNPSEALTKSIADVVCGITFGKYFSSSHQDFTKFIKLTNRSFGDAELNNQLFFLDLFYFTRYLPFKAYKENQQGTDFLLGVVRKVLKERKLSFDLSGPVDDLMTGFLKARAEAERESKEEKQVHLSDDYMVSSLYDMISAGYETTTSALKWAILYLVNFPRYQEEIHDELDKVVGPNRMPSLHDRPQLPLIQATIRESLRLGNVADLSIPHYTLTDTTLCGYRIPKDTVVLTDLEALHLNPKCWENPTEFNPHRHIDTEGQLITNQGHWLPFSAGRRVCSGEALAKAELFLILAWMLHKFKFVPEEGKSPPVIKGIKGFTQSPQPYKILTIER